MPDMDFLLRRVKLSDLRLLQAVVEWGGMARAAAHLNISQPAVSKAIAALERSVGVRLLDRSPLGVQPTTYGRVLLTGGQAVFDDLAQCLAHIEYLSDPNSGHLRIGCTEFGASGWVPEVIDQFCRGRPGVTFHVATGSPTFLIERELAERRIDLAFGAIPHVDPMHFDRMDLFVDRQVVMVGRDSRWSRRRNLSLADLAAEPWILPAADTEIGRLIDEAFRDAASEPPHRRIVAYSVPLTLHLLSTGRYISLLPQIVAQRNRHWPIRVLAVTPPRIERTVGIVTLKGRTLTPLAHAFIDCAKQAATARQTT